MVYYIEIVYRALFYLPHFLLAVLIVFCLYLVLYKSVRYKVCVTYQYKYLPYSFLYVSALGAIWNIVLGFIDVNANASEIIIGSRNQIKGLNHAVGLLITGISLFLGCKLFIDNDTSCPHSKR